MLILFLLLSLTWWSSMCLADEIVQSESQSLFSLAPSPSPSSEPCFPTNITLSTPTAFNETQYYPLTVEMILSAINDFENGDGLVEIVYNFSYYHALFPNDVTDCSNALDLSNLPYVGGISYGMFGTDCHRICVVTIDIRLTCPLEYDSGNYSIVIPYVGVVNVTIDICVQGGDVEIICPLVSECAAIPPTTHKKKKNNHDLAVGLGVGLGVGIPIVCCLILFLWWVTTRDRRYTRQK